MSYFDDIIIHGATKKECEENLINCLQRLKKYNLHLNKNKCSFFKTRVEYLGFVIQFNEISKSPSKVQAITEMPRPASADEVRRFLGMVTYYSRFVPNLSSITYPLRQLLQKNIKFYWSSNCEAAFSKLKAIISSEKVLTPFDPELPVIVACDASPTGIAGVISHKIGDIERPIAYASRSLTPAEQNYSQLDREALAIVFSVNHFFMYLYGRKFQLVTDNKPLTRIFHHSSKLPSMTSARLLRYAEFLSSFNYEVVYKKGSEHVNVDCLSRATKAGGILSTDKLINEEVNELCYLSIFEISNEYINAETLAQETTKDPDLSKILSNLLNTNENENNYTLCNGIIFKGQRILIPKNIQPHILRELHRTHPGITKMKQLARRYCYWKGIDRDIERMVRSCEACAQVQSKPAKVQLHHWEEPTGNWERIHIDYAGPFQNHHFLIVVDAKSKWIEFRAVRNSPTTQITLNLLTDIFSTHGFPSVLVSDNATIFTSETFKAYCKENGIFQKFTAPGHPSTNGLAERNVQTLKNKLKAMTYEPGSIQSKLNEISQIYRATPLICGKSPAELYLNRRIRIRLDALKPTVKIKSNLKTPGVRTISVGERVQTLHTMNNKTVWKMGIVLRKYGQLHYLVKLDDGYTLKRHIDQLKVTNVEKRKVRFDPKIDINDSTRDSGNQHEVNPTILPNRYNVQPSALINYPNVEPPTCQINPEPQLPPNQGSRDGTEMETPITQVPGAENPEQNQEPSIRRSQRVRKRPTHLQDFITD